MQLPYGKLVSSRKGAADLKEVGEAVAKDGLTGYLRVSLFDSSTVQECVVVYLAGKPVLAFASDGSADRKDGDYRQMSEAIRKDGAIVEVCQLQDRQVKLLQDVYREFAMAAPAAAAVAVPAKPAPKEPPRAAATLKPEEKPRLTSAPEIRGRFVRAEEVRDLDEYLQLHPGETGHLVLMTQPDGRMEEQHIILIKGRIEAAYNGEASGRELVDRLKGVPGLAEFYAVGEALLTNVIGRHMKRDSPPAADKPARERLAPERLASGIGIPARDLLESPRPATHARDEISRAIGEISFAMEDDVAMVRKVEREFASHVDELLTRLELSHLRTRNKK